jgi:hypothetical protein
MKLRTKAVWSLAIALCWALIGAAPLAAQTVTTGNIAGTVTDAQGGVLPGATVVAVHTDTGTTYEAVTGTDGRYNILNVRVGGYNIAVNMQGFREQKQERVIVELGAERTADFKLQLATVSETVDVIASSPLIDLSRAGTADNIPNEVKENLPTISRSLTDIVRISPMFNTFGGGSGADQGSVVSVAGNSYRYNSLQIDGAVNNDLFGLASSAGVPGGTAETQPVSLDAIQEIQLVVSPYDVRQGGFSGGGINAITKSGTNSVRGTVFVFGRNQNWVGKGVTNTKISTFKHNQWGGSLGGPVVRNKAFFFGTLDYERKERPTGFSVGGPGQQFRDAALFERVINGLKSRYGYDPGANPGDEFVRATNNNKYFFRGDFNVAKGHQLVVRHNYVDAFNDIGTPSTTFFKTPDNYYRYMSNTNSTVGQLNSQVGKGVNELRITYTRVRDHRASPIGNPPFPQVTVQAPGGLSVQAGTEQFSARNAIDQDIIELNDAFTWITGRHTFTFGSHNEFLDLANLFIRDNFGSYTFTNVDNFEAGLAQGFNHSFSATSDPQQRAAFKVRQWGFYAGDQWRVRPSLTLTYGVRADAPTFPEKPTSNPVAVAAFGYATDVVPSHIQWSPRVGVNYDLSGNGTQQVRGGIGLFSGRPAYVWISNQFGNTGIDFTRIGATTNAANRIPFASDPLNQPKVVTGASAGSFTNEIDVIDPDFKYPSVLRGNAGYDHQLWGGFYGTFDFVFSKTVKDIKYQNLNFAPNGATGIGGRPMFSRVNTSLSDVILLENTTKGHTWNVAYEARRPFTNGLFIQGAYSYGQAKSIMDGTSDQAASNWGFVYVPGNPNDAPLSRSNFDPGHRVTMTASYDFPFLRTIKPGVSVFYARQSGRPYTMVYSNSDVNGDGRNANDLVYLPAATDALTYTGGTYNDLLNFLSGGDGCLADYVGQIIPRNACRAPWTNTLDAKFKVELPYRRFRTEVTLDVLNLVNLIDRQKGLITYQSNNNLVQPGAIPANPTATSPVTGYNITTLVSPTFTRFLRDDLRSRWQLQLGARVRF